MCVAPSDTLTLQASADDPVLVPVAGAMIEMVAAATEQQGTRTHV